MECPFYLNSTSYFGVAGVSAAVYPYEDDPPVVAAARTRESEEPPIIDCETLKEIPGDSDDDCISDKWERGQLTKLKEMGALTGTDLADIDVNNIKKEDLEKFLPEWDDDPIVQTNENVTTVYKKGDGLTLKTEYRGYSLVNEPDSFAGRLNAYQPEKFIKYGSDLEFEGETYTAEATYEYAIGKIEELDIKLIDVGTSERAYPYHTSNTSAQGEALKGFEQILKLNLKDHISSENNGIHLIYFVSDSGGIKEILASQNGYFPVIGTDGEKVQGAKIHRLGEGNWGSDLFEREANVFLGTLINWFKVGTDGKSCKYTDKAGNTYTGKYYINSAPKNCNKRVKYRIKSYNQKVDANLSTISDDLVNIEAYGDGIKDSNIFEMSLEQALNRIPLHELGHNFSIVEHPERNMYILRIKNNGPFTPMGEGIGKWVGEQFIEDADIDNITELSLDFRF